MQSSFSEARAASAILAAQELEADARLVDLELEHARDARERRMVHDRQEPLVDRTGAGCSMAVAVAAHRSLAVVQMEASQAVEQVVRGELVRQALAGIPLRQVEAG